MKDGTAAEKAPKRGKVNVILSIVLLVLISRALMLFTGYIGMNLFSKSSQVPVYMQNVPGTLSKWTVKLPGELASTEKLKLEDFIKFDTYSYLKIATQGYDKFQMDEPHTAANWVFFPLFPLLIFLVGKIFWFEPAIVGMIVSNLCLLGALIYIYFIALQRGLSERQAGISTIANCDLPIVSLLYLTVHREFISAAFGSLHLLCRQ